MSIHSQINPQNRTSIETTRKAGPGPPPLPNKETLINGPLTKGK